MTAEEYLRSKGIGQSTKVTANDYLQSKGISPLPVAPVKKSLGSDLIKAYENFGTGIIQGVQGVGRYLTSAAQQTGKTINTGYNIFNQASNLLGKKQVNKPLELYNKAQSKIADVSGKATTKIGQAMDKKQEQAQYQTSQISNPLVKKASEYSTAIGQQIPTIAASIINPALGLGVATTSAGGNYLQEAKQKGASDLQALTVGTAKGLAEGATEMIGIGKVIKGTKALAKGSTKAAIKDFGINIVNNALQEASMEPLSETIDQSVLGKSDWNGIAKRMIKAGIDGAIIGTIMSGAGAGIGNAVNVTNKIAQGKTVTPQEIQQVSNEIKPIIETTKQQRPITEQLQASTTQTQPVLPTQVSKVIPEVKIPLEVANLGISKTQDSLQKSTLLTKESKQALVDKGDISYYEKINNKTTLEEASNELKKGGQQEINRWLSIEDKSATAKDVAKGMILLDTYQNQGDYDSMIQVAKKLTKLGTEAGKTVQAFSIMQRLTPEGMVKYAQSQLTDIETELLKTKTQEWITKNVGEFDLNQQEVQFIIDKMKEVQNLPEGRQRIVKLAEINKLITNKIPPKIGEGIKAYRRIAMLLNPKTINRNILGNAIITPLNALGESTAGTIVDKLLSKYTGVRTTGITDVKSYSKGFREGLSNAFEDFIKGINTRDISADKFEIGRGKNFKNKGLGKVLNKLDALTSFSLDIGDRPFFQAEFMNSLNNQMKLNKVTEPTTDMIEVATKIAEQKTWQDNNAYSKGVVGVRNGLNKLNIKGVGLGDIVIPFAKTPANLTKALVDYSPAGIITTIVDSNKLRIALKTGNFTPQLQRAVANDVSKAFVGTILYILGGSLAKAGITSGKADEDKDVAKFEKDILGKLPYSIKIGDKSFSYDWAQPIATPLGVMANVVKGKKEDANVLQNVLDAFAQGGNMIYEQSFLQNIKRLFTSYEGPVQGIIETLGTIPASFVPTLIKQLNEIIDPYQRTSYEYKDVGKTSINQAIAKIPFLSKNLSIQQDTLGRDIKKYSGDNNLGNIFLNPANTSKENTTKGSEELLKVYNATGDKTIIPRVAANYFDYQNNKYVLTAKEKNDWQKNIGTNVSNTLDKLVENDKYNALDNTEKAKVINEILNYSQALEKQNYLRDKGVDYQLTSSYNTLKDKQNNNEDITDYLLLKETGNKLTDTKINDYYNLKGLNIPEETLSDYYSTIGTIEGQKDALGKTISGSKKEAALQYINALPLNNAQKVILATQSGYKVYDHRTDLINYIQSLPLTVEKKTEIWNSLGYK
jgi:hypothetical protein